MRATFRNLYHEFNVAAFFRDRRDHTMSVVRWTLILLVATGLNLIRRATELLGAPT